MWSFELRLHLQGISVQLLVTGKDAFKNQMKQFWISFWIFRAIRTLMNHSKNLIFFPVLPKNSEVAVETPAAKKKLVLTGKFDFEKWIESIWNAFTGWVALLIFNAEIEKFKYPIPSYAIGVKFPIGICFALEQYANCAYRDYCPSRSRQKKFKTRVGNFAQSWFWWINQNIDLSLLFSFTALRFPMQISLDKKTYCDEDFWLSESRWINLECTQWMFCAGDISIQGSKKLLSTPNKFYKCEVSIWD